MSTIADKFAEHALFNTIKAQIMNLAVAMYGTHAVSTTNAYEVLTFTTPPYSSDDDPSYGVALILYTGPPDTPFVSWEMLSHISNASSALGGAEKLLEDIQAGMGQVIGEVIASGNWEVLHKKIPDMRDDGGEADEVVHEGSEHSKWQTTLDGIEEEVEESDE